MDEPLSAAIERFNRETDTGGKLAHKIPVRLKLKDIHTEPTVFQVRSLGLDAERARRISEDLKGGDKEDPIQVWWSGKRYIVIDGHHRLEAYRIAQERRGVALWVPVKVHAEMTLQEAQGWAAKMNLREKEPISKEERLNAAWRLVCQEQGSKKEQAEWSGASVATIGNMRKKHGELRSENWSANRLLNTPWDKARDHGRDKGQGEYTEEMAEANARVLKEAICAAMNGNPTRDPDRIAYAISLISEDLPLSVMQSDYWDKSREDLDEEEDMLRDEDDEDF